MTLNICSDLETRQIRWVDNSKNQTPQSSYVIAGQYRENSLPPKPIVIK